MRRILRRIKEGFKRAVSKRPKKARVEVSKVKPQLRKRIVLAKKEARIEKVPAEMVVSESKFYTPPQIQEEKKPYPMPTELPAGYGYDKIVLQVRDPWWVHAYWEITESTWERLRREFPASFAQGVKKLLRVYDISQIIFDGTNAHRFFDIEITDQANNWYIDTQTAGRSWCADFGVLLLPEGKFIAIARSNTVTTPLEGPSWVTDEEWMIPEEMFVRLYGMGVGFGSSPLKVRKLWEQRLKREFASGALFSISSPVKKAVPRGFWLVVNTELIVYGQTEPDAKVSIQGRPIDLRPDGSFSLRFFLPDGKQAIPVVATSCDGAETRGITPIVTKETK